jgi:hypothetical protein
MTFDVLGAAGHPHADGLDLIDGRIGRIAPPRERVEEDVAADDLPQPRGETGVSGEVGHGAAIYPICGRVWKAARVRAAR